MRALLWVRVAARAEYRGTRPMFEKQDVRRRSLKGAQDIVMRFTGSEARQREFNIGALANVVNSIENFGSHPFYRVFVKWSEASQDSPYLIVPAAVIFVRMLMRVSARSPPPKSATARMLDLSRHRIQPRQHGAGCELSFKSQCKCLLCSQASRPTS